MPTTESAAICWFRNDLRLADNPAFSAACRSERPIIALYILEDAPEGVRSLGGASRWWLDKSLRELEDRLAKRGLSLTLRKGDPQAVLREICEKHEIASVFWNRRYGVSARAVDSNLKSKLKSNDIQVETFNGTLLVEPWTMQTTSGGPYRVFTPFWKALRSDFSPILASEIPSQLKDAGVKGDDISDWALHPTEPDWSEGFDELWAPGEAGALKCFERFLEERLQGYGTNRDRPDLDGTSGLSPHLRFGEISPHLVWRKTIDHLSDHSGFDDDGFKFLSELAWRDFSHNLIYHFDDFPAENYNSDFDHFPWDENANAQRAWQRGHTGYPIVDAGMRQLWETGWMHNRVRMIVASFLTKHLLQHWKVGEDWFWDTLVDADLANNSAGWQWTAGSGADASPYFRIFNPISQGQKFDPDGSYVRRWIPELSDVPTKLIHEPWSASDEILDKANVRLGDNYPKPIVDHSDARKRALNAYDEMKSKRDAA